MKVLAVDDQEDNLDLLLQVLEENNYEVITAKNGKEAISITEKEKPDVILLDIHMPIMDGYETCKILKNNVDTAQIPIIFLTANTAEESVVKGLELGAYDYVTKPFNEKELLARINVMLRIREMEKRKDELALKDSLTGLYNRHFLTKRLDEEISRAKRKERPLSCIMLDIDHFKKINDTYGHDAGDIVLKEIANIFKKNLREYDVAVRYGGEEFLIILPSTKIEQAEIVGEKIREKVQEHVFKINDTVLEVRVSVGVFGCLFEDIPEKEASFITCADKALYLAKNTGRNKVVVYGRN